MEILYLYFQFNFASIRKIIFRITNLCGVHLSAGRKMTKERIQNRALFTSEHISEYKEAFRLRDENTSKTYKNANM